MLDYLHALHLLSAALVLGSLFMISLAVVMNLRLPAPLQREGVRILLRRVYLFIYYPILGVALLSGLALALFNDAFASAWLPRKVLAVVILVGLGGWSADLLRRERIAKPLAMMLHVGIFLVGFGIVLLASMADDPSS